MNRLDKLSKRIEALEGENRRSPREQWPTPDDWLETFKEFGEESGKANDPDFQAALAALASAIEEAKRNPDKASGKW